MLTARHSTHRRFRSCSEGCSKRATHHAPSRANSGSEAREHTAALCALQDSLLPVDTVSMPDKRRLRSAKHRLLQANSTAHGRRAQAARLSRKTAWAVVICLALTYGPVHGFYTNALQRETAPLGVLRAQLAVRLAVLVLIHILAVFASEAVGPTC